MSRNRSSRGRNRGRRGRPAESAVDGQRPQEPGNPSAPPSSADGPEHDGSGPSKERSASSNTGLAESPHGGVRQRSGQSRDRERPPTQRDANRGARPGGGERSGAGQRDAPSGPRGGNANTRGRRRPQRRPPVLLPAPTAVLREHAPVTPSAGPMAKRPMSALGDATELNLGCPMLSRTRLRLPVTGNDPAPRCSLGWALHSEDEVVFCLHTPDAHSCWKANPERRQALQALFDGDRSAAD